MISIRLPDTSDPTYRRRTYRRGSAAGGGGPARGRRNLRRPHRGVDPPRPCARLLARRATGKPFRSAYRRATTSFPPPRGAPRHPRAVTVHSRPRTVSRRRVGRASGRVHSLGPRPSNWSRRRWSCGPPTTATGPSTWARAAGPSPSASPWGSRKVTFWRSTSPRWPSTQLPSTPRRSRCAVASPSCAVICCSAIELAADDIGIIVSNPPYAAHSDEVDPEVRDHEPSEAWVAGSTGLEIYERLIPRRRRRLLRPGRSLVLELGYRPRHRASPRPYSTQ